MQSNRDDRSLGELFAELSRESTTLVRQEMALAKTELTQKAVRAGKDIAFLAVGGVIVYAGFLGVMAAVILVLATVLPAWLAALIVGVVVAGVGYVLLQRGRDALKREDLAPRQTVDTIRGDLDALKGGRT